MNYYKNNAFSVLASAATSGDTTLTLATGTGSRFPAANFLVTLIGYDGSGNENAWEIVRCTSRSDDILTVVRAQEGTTATAWPSAARIENRVTAAAMEEVQTAINELDAKKANLASPTLTGVPAAPTAAVGTNTTQLATTAFVSAEIANDAAPIAHVGSGGTAHANVVAAGAAGFMSGTDKTKLDGIAAGAQVNAVTSVAEKTGAVTLVKGDVGLGNVDNTSDAAKSVLSATKLATARTINGVSFDGSENISVNAAAVPNTPAGSIAATTVQAAINELDAEKVSNVVVLPSITDLNTVLTSGFYRMNEVSNGPSVTVDYGQLIVSRGLDTISQIAISFTSGRMFTRSGSPSYVGGGGTITPWREVYTSASILGTVSQSAGVPTGAVIERGSNANGEYVRYADGTQICTGTGAMVFANTQTIFSDVVFAAAFIATPAASCGFTASPALLFSKQVNGPTPTAIRTTGFRVNVQAPAANLVEADATDLGSCIYMAVGRWL